MTHDMTAILDEHAIRRVLLRYCRGIDRRDLELVRSCYWPEATDVHGPFSGTRDEFVAWVERLLRRHTMTMHHVGNMLVDVRGEAAEAETYCVAYHSGDPVGDVRWNYVAGVRYVDRFEKRSGEWRIADRMTAIEWMRPWDADRDLITAVGGESPR